MTLADLLKIAPDDCTCTWAGQYEGEDLGMVYGITEVHRRCPHHGRKPRRPKPTGSETK